MEITDIVQLISLPLELFGLVLTILEIFYHEKSIKLESKISKAIKQIQNLPVKKYNRLIIINSLGFFVLGFGFTIYQPYVSNPYLLTILEVLCVLAWMSFFTTSIYPIYNNLLPDRRVLVYGLTLSTLGIIGEIFQVINIF